jgi:Protein ChrB, N-terminal
MQGDAGRVDERACTGQTGRGVSEAGCLRGTLPAVPARSNRQSDTRAGGDVERELSTTWLLLIYTVPAQPSRKRATVWREIKKLGAVYLRDGVCILPEQPDTQSSLRELAARIQELEGEASVVEGGRLDQDRGEAVMAQFLTARAAEYAEIAREAQQLLAHIARETEHREFTYAELEELEQDLGKLRRWTDQVHARDYFAESSYSNVQALLERCEGALETFVDQASTEAAEVQR